MDSYELNKILGALLFTCLCLLSLNIAAERDVRAAQARETRLRRRGPGEGVDARAARRPPPRSRSRSCSRPRRSRRARPPPRSAPPAIPSARASRTASGPNLYGVVGRERGSHAGFNYSAGMKAKPGKWTVEDLNAFLLNPKGFVPGTSMSFAGVPRGSERADLITYLNSKSDSPAPLPKAAEAPAAQRSAEAQAGTKTQ